MFVNQGIRALRQYQRNAPNESRSMILFSKGYTDEQIEAIRNSVESYSGVLVLVNNVDEMFNYINSSKRESDKILNMEIYSHGLSGSIEFGYKFENNDALRLEKSNADQLKGSSFKMGASIISYACRTALGNNSSVFTFSRDIDNSLAQKMANSAKVDVFAYASRTSYEGTLGSVLDRHPFASTFMPVGVNPMPIPETKIISGAAFTSHGANRGVTAGSTPFGGGILIQQVKPNNE